MAPAYDVPMVAHICRAPPNIHSSVALYPNHLSSNRVANPSRLNYRPIFLKNRVFAERRDVPVPNTSPIFELKDEVIANQDVVFEAKLYSTTRYVENLRATDRAVRNIS